MSRKLVLSASAGMILIVALATLAQDNGTEPEEGLTFLGEPVTKKQIDAGANTYADKCASCHGADLEGQPDWQRRLDNGRMPAPPHDETGHSWHHSDRSLFLVTKGGVQAIVPGYESDMPAFKEVLSDAEIINVLAFIKSRWPDRQSAFQTEVTENDRGGL